MPVYEYQCLSCKKVHEIIQKFSDKPVTKCPDCMGEVKKMISSTSFVLKGSGWYVTDYASKGRDKGSNDNGGSKGTAATQASDAGKKSETVAS